jgi:hypothetical protein
MIHEPAKVQYICHIRDIANAECRAAELALFCRQPNEAENILLAANQVYKAIIMIYISLIDVWTLLLNSRPMLTRCFIFGGSIFWVLRGWRVIRGSCSIIRRLMLTRRGYWQRSLV